MRTKFVILFVLLYMSHVRGDGNDTNLSEKTQVESAKKDSESDDNSFEMSTTVSTLSVDTTNIFLDVAETTTEYYSTTDQTSTIVAPVCELESIEHEVMEVTSKLKFNWEINDSLLCNNKTIIISLVNQDCSIQCADEPNCMSSCTKNSLPINVTRLTYIFPFDLIPCVKYYYVISLPDSTKKNDTEPFALQKYRKVENFSVTDEENNGTVKQLDMYIQWTYLYKECQPVFKITAHSQTNTHERTTTEHRIKIPNLPACEEFNITIYPLGQEDFIVTESFTMRKIHPSPVRNFVLYQDQDKSLIKLNYSSPEYGASCIKRYIAQVVNEYENFEMDVTVPIISDVFACLNYTITLKASIDDNESGHPAVTTLDYFSTETTLEREMSETLSIKTQPRVFAQPQQPKQVDSTSKTLKLEVITAVETRNRCAISKYRIKCISNEIGNVEKFGESKDANVTIEDLLPYHNYSCAACIENEVSEPSEWSSSTTFMTKEGVPNAPIVRITNETSKSFTIIWDKPTQPNGYLKEYRIFVMFTNFLYDLPEYCEKPDFIEKNFTFSARAEKLEFDYDEALAYSKYTVQIQAVNQGSTYGEISRSTYVKTKEDSSDEVRHLEIILNEVLPNQPYNKNITVKFSKPCRSKGELDGFRIQFDPGFLETLLLNDLDDNLDDFAYTTDKLEPDISYSVSVNAFSSQYPGAAVLTTFELRAGIPARNDNIFDTIHTEVSAKQAYISIPINIFDSDVGGITLVKILIGQSVCQMLEPVEGLIEDEENHEISKWKEAKDKSCIPLYDTGIRVHKDEVHKNEGIGVQDRCDEVSIYCNGPLRPGTGYGITFRLYTKTGFSDTPYIRIITKKEIPIFTIAIIILSILCLVFLVGLYVSYRRTRQLRKSAIDSPYDRKDISIQNFPAYYSAMKQNEKEKIHEEFKAVDVFSDNTSKSFIASKANENLNRYLNVYPYDLNRVVLNDDEFDNDYINASYVNGYFYPKEYIAAQGPKPNTIIDFWRMVLQHKVESIVMLTSLVENNKVKCSEYFPKLTGRIDCINISVTCIEEQKFDHYIKRVMSVEKDDVKLKVNHYYFLKWPDHGCPNDPLDLINFVRIVRNQRQKLGETFIVHCSAGVGRTGTFIALDIMMQRIKKEGKINIYDLVKQLRAQRMKMVQTFDQYQFLYRIAMELVAVPRSLDALRDIKDSVIQHIHDFEFTKHWKWPKRRERLNAAKTENAESSV